METPLKILTVSAQRAGVAEVSPLACLCVAGEGAAAWSLLGGRCFGLCALWLW